MEDYYEYPLNYTDAVETEPQEVSTYVLKIFIAIITVAALVFNLLLIILIVVSKELREKTSYWFIVSLMISNSIFVDVYFGGERNKSFFQYPWCYAILPLAATSFHVSLWTMVVYAIVILHEARQVMKLRNPAGCRKAVVGGLIAAVWIVCLVEVLVTGFAVAKMEIIDHNGEKMCIFMAHFSLVIEEFMSVFTTYMPYLIMLICGIVFAVFSCKSHAVRQTCVPVTLMCIVTPLLNLPYFILKHPGMYSGTLVNSLIALCAFSWLLVPLYFLILGEGRKAVRNACCKCCRPSDEEETTQLVLK